MTNRFLQLEAELRALDPKLTLSRQVRNEARALATPSPRRRRPPARRTRALDVTSDSPQREQSEAVLERIIWSLRGAESEADKDAAFSSLHNDSNRVNFGIASWTGPRIAALLDTYVTVARENGAEATLYGYFGGQPAFQAVQQRFATQGTRATLSEAESTAFRRLGQDHSLREAQLRHAAQDVRRDLAAIDRAGTYPFIDGYMNAISEVAAHVLVHASHQHGQALDLIAAVKTLHGGEAALGQQMVNGTLTERQFLSEIGDQVVQRVEARYRDGVRKRYDRLLDRYSNSGLSFYFSPSAPSTAQQWSGALDTSPIPSAFDLLSFIETRERRSDYTDPQRFRERVVEMVSLFNGFGHDDRPYGRRAAYGDIIAWGEEPSMRAALLEKTLGNSSCGLIIRSLWRLLGARDPLLDPPYKLGTVISNLRTFAINNGAYHPVRRREDFNPQPGDVILLTKEEADPSSPTGKRYRQHIFTLLRREGDVFVSLDGGQSAPPGTSLDDGSCNGIRKRRRTLSRSGLFFERDDRPIVAWIDVTRLPFTAPIIGVLRGNNPELPDPEPS